MDWPTARVQQSLSSTEVRVTQKGPKQGKARDQILETPLGISMDGTSREMRNPHGGRHRAAEPYRMGPVFSPAQV